MTIIEALKASREDGKSYMRVHGGGGFCSWQDNAVFRFDIDDLIADDWECVDTGIPKLTGGKWAATQPRDVHDSNES